MHRYTPTCDTLLQFSLPAFFPDLLLIVTLHGILIALANIFHHCSYYAFPQQLINTVCACSDPGYIGPIHQIRPPQSPFNTGRNSVRVVNAFCHSTSL